jgi:hypothetical protein
VWLLPYYWGAAFGPPTAPITWWDWPGRPLREPAADAGGAEPTDLDIELVRVVYELLADPSAAPRAARGFMEQ